MVFCGAKARVFFIGTFFILQHQCSVAVQSKVISHDFVNLDLLILPPEDQPEACQKDVRGEGMLVGRIVFGVKGTFCYSYIFPKSSSYEEIIWHAVARECNGKNRCKLSDSIKLRVAVQCGTPHIPANQIDIIYECKPIKPDNKQVFSITPELSANATAREFNTSYLVLDLPQASPTEIHCEINGNNRELKFTLLHVDFGPNLNCNASSKCHGHITITDEKMKTINYTYNWLPEEMFNEYLKFVTFDISMSTGLVWIQLEGYVEIHVECRDIKESRNTPHITETTSPRNQEIRPENNGTKGISNTTHIPVTSSADGSGDGLILFIVISVSVALLVSLIVIGALVVCRFSRKRRMTIYDIPVVTDPDLHPYNKPIVETQQGTGHEYLEIGHCDDGYEEPTVAFQHARLAM